VLLTVWFYLIYLFAMHLLSTFFPVLPVLLLLLPTVLFLLIYLLFFYSSTCCPFHFNFSLSLAAYKLLQCFHLLCPQFHKINLLANGYNGNKFLQTKASRQNWSGEETGKYYRRLVFWEKMEKWQEILLYSKKVLVENPNKNILKKALKLYFLSRIFIFYLSSRYVSK